MKFNLYSNLFFKNQPPAPSGPAGWGCIPGATKLEMWQPKDPAEYNHNCTQAVMPHVEPWVNLPHDFKTKQERESLKGTLSSLCEKIAAKAPSAEQWWYMPPKLGAEFFLAQHGDKASQQKVKQFTSDTFDLSASGIPGPRCKGPCIDCYDYFDYQGVWEKRIQAQVAPWHQLGRSVLPILYLRWHYAGGTPDKPVNKAGEMYTEKLARYRLEFLHTLCGRVAVHDGYGPDGVYEDYQTWPLRGLVESLARGA